MSVATASRPLSAADHVRVMSEYGRRAEARAYALGNRGPIRVGADGKLLPEILDAYWANGFYVFQGVVGPEELAELRADIDNVLSHAPVAPDAKVDRQGRPAAVLDRCPHKGASLSAGFLKDGALACGYHGWCFQADGHCQSIPAQHTGEPMPRRAP